MNGGSKPTINDVAKRAGVSKKTVSRVINKSPLLSDATRERVETVIADLGYVPNPQARALALRRNFIIAVIHDNPNAQFLVNVQKGILDALENSEFGLMVQPVDRTSPTIEDDLRGFFERQRPYGVVLLPPISERDNIAELCREFGCRYVRMGSVKLDAAENTVTSNDREAVQDAVSYLIAKGHSRIALIEGPEGFTSPQERRAGFEQAMIEAGLVVDEALVRPGSYTFESGVAAAESLVTLDPRPTAIFACNDEMAIGAMIAARRSGLRIPEDMSIVGFDDTPLSSHVWPSLTTVRWPIVEMAFAAARKLICPEDAAAEEPWLLPSTLVERSSVVPPAGT
ncbi:LacI family DNA-binding transcriptional regulator [Aurantiacibacter spongiae]|uniref:LacI family DNA-binding transcriptional regulator n=1 Tax=Aurantiacibacter spongiae TaxID=2488860 RepID=A0A3N5CRJ3_9SPHN|nr:LacI family DNA-binding transcriptional regulator [Aurantiacibacter spongiae]RPF70956.1 LacI family DNA-binding transcriptional regulator [Aurantiacibacter spongiae]